MVRSACAGAAPTSASTTAAVMTLPTPVMMPSMSYETIQREQSGGIGRITLNRPESLNAWTTQFGHELSKAVNQDAADPSVRAVLITGAGRGFSSGADLKEGF